MNHQPVLNRKIIAPGTQMALGHRRPAKLYLMVGPIVPGPEIKVILSFLLCRFESSLPLGAVVIKGLLRFKQQTLEGPGSV